jgi:two-component system, OmpR family, response regulator
MLIGLQKHQSLGSFTSISHKVKFRKAKVAVSETNDFRSQHQPLSSSRILVVDSHVDTCHLFSLVLEEAGANVVVANSCEEALIHIQEKSPNLLISEIDLPGENGLTLIRKARELMAQVGQPILALAVTSHTENEEKLEICAAGFQGYLSKPVDIYEFVEVVTDLVEQSAIKQALPELHCQDPLG